MQKEKVYIFGAQSRGKTLKGYLEFLYPEVKILSFLVDDMAENATEIDGIPVRRTERGQEWDNSARVFIATKGIYHAEIQNRLTKLDFHEIIPVTVEVDNFFRNEYVKKYMKQQGREFVKLVQLPSPKQAAPMGVSARIYMAKSIYDKPLQTIFSLPEYVKPIQVGAILTEERLEADILTDCLGDNISHKNRQYSELTALYWIWKHAREEIVGLCHYRRHFVLPDNWLAIMAENEIDVILPVPTVVLPNIGENYRERHDATDWKFLMEYLQYNSQDDYKVAEKVFGESLYSPCNMFIAKRKIVDELCQWMFPILEAVERNGGIKTDVYQNRYPGFISERLITLFFHKRCKQYKIVYADKVFLG